MPQLDVISFSSQLFWFYVVFILSFLISLIYILPVALSIFHIRAYLQKFRPLKLKQSNVHEARDEIISDVLQICDFTSLIDAQIKKSLKEKNHNQIWNKLQKRNLNIVFNAKFALYAFLIPSDEFILFSAFIIFVIGAYISTSNSFSLTSRITELNTIFEQIHSSQIHILKTEISFVKSILLMRNDIMSILYETTSPLFAENFIYLFKTDQLKNFLSRQLLLIDSATKSINFKTLPDITTIFPTQDVYRDKIKKYTVYF